MVLEEKLSCRWKKRQRAEPCFAIFASAVFSHIFGNSGKTTLSGFYTSDIYHDLDLHIPDTLICDVEKVKTCGLDSAGDLFQNFGLRARKFVF